MTSAASDALRVHRSFYDAVESGDADLMASLWAQSEHVTCVHPGAAPVRGTATVLRTWTLLMANVDYIQFFLTDIDVMTLPPGDDAPHTAVITCTENILSGEGMVSTDSFSGSKAIATNVLVRAASTGPAAASWKFWTRHASPVFEDFSAEREP